MPHTDETSLGFFVAEEDRFVPLETARGPWGRDTIGGQGLTALTARELERHCPVEPAGCRLTVDFIRPSTFDVVQTRTELIRSSKRLALVQIELVQSERVVVRASGLFVRPAPTDKAGANAWSPELEFSRPAWSTSPADGMEQAPMISSAGYPHDWSSNFADHRNTARKRMWTPTMIPAVRGEKPTPFTRIATLSEATSFVTNWGGDSVPFINADVTLNLCRMPESEGIGMESNGQHVANGTAIGSATLYDEYGIVGVSSITAIANTHREVHF
ncbi:acyl-CoA thioesterase domain-containing protein [Nocardia sp. CA-136227]|uniref:acyl-CoA thioesterase domain-containing protein n=1 Tax=Nocardia sp. CA-136227 TaxID=3239979 RepID=UPI003D95D27C